MQQASPSPRYAGFTLIELMLVMSVIGILAGFGLGFLQRRGSDVEVALEMVRDELRIAGLTARTRRLPAEVLFDLGDDTGRSPAVRSRVLIPVGQWSMEEREGNDPRLIPEVVTGLLEPGRFGLARRPDPGEDLLRVATRESVDTIFNLHEGFALSVDVKLEEREVMVFVELSANLVLSVDSDLIPEVKFVQRDGDASGGSVSLVGDRPLRLNRWIAVTVAHDREFLTLMVDGATVARRTVKTSLYQSDNDLFIVSPSSAPVLGLIDEVRLLSYEFTDSQQFPPGVELVGQFDRIRFGRDGRLAEPVEFSLVFGEERGDFVVDPGGLIQ